MHCPRLRHYSRLNQNGTIGRCGHMIGGESFRSHKELEESQWIEDLEQQMNLGNWPDECLRCKRTEEAGGKSIRLASIDRHKLLKPLRSDYLIVGGVLDNVCNSACQTCNAGLSTKIGSLETKNYQRVDNTKIFETLPQERILELDVNGGEPTASKNYKKLLETLPENVVIVRMNTNGSKNIKEIEEVLKKNIKVIITLSIDGIANVHDYTRWPIKWEDYRNTVDHYRRLRDRYRLLDLDFWTTVSCLNVENLPKIIDYTKKVDIPHNWAFLEKPHVLNTRFKNVFTDRAKHIYPGQIAIDKNNDDLLVRFIRAQDRLRGIDCKDYFSFL